MIVYWPKDSFSRKALSHSFHVAAMQTTHVVGFILFAMTLIFFNAGEPYHQAIATEVEELAPKELTLSDLVAEDYEPWIEMGGDVLVVPTALRQSVLFEDLFTNNELIAGSYQELYISYDMDFVPKNSEMAQILYDQRTYRTRYHPNTSIYQVYRVPATQRFVYPDGTEAMLLPGAHVSLAPAPAYHRLAEELPFYFTTLFPSQRILLPPMDFDADDLLAQQRKNFKRYLHTNSNRAISIDPETGVVAVASGSMPIASLLRNSSIGKVVGLRTIGVVKSGVGLIKVKRSKEDKTYVDLLQGNELLLSDGDKLIQVADNKSADIDSLSSTPYIDYGNKVTGCSRTKRLNAYKFAIRLPYGEGPYATSKVSHVTTGYLGASDNEFGSIEEFDITKDNRWELLDDSLYPEKTNFIEIVFHSASELGRKYGHGAVAFKYENQWWILDPYIDVSGYGETDPKLLDDYLRSKKATENLSVAKIFYYDTPVEIGGVPMSYLPRYLSEISLKTKKSS